MERKLKLLLRQNFTLTVWLDQKFVVIFAICLIVSRSAGKIDDQTQYFNKSHMQALLKLHMKPNLLNEKH